jgi:predicted DNA-binding transcriptional regulator YafY
VLARVQIDIDYAKPGRGAERRRVQPYGLVDKGGVWYLLAGTERGRRTFRVSRLTGVSLTDEPVQLPEGFDLAAEWADAEREFLSGLQVEEVVIEVTDEAVLGVTAGIGSWATITERAGAPPGWRRFAFAVPHRRGAAPELARFGNAIRVVSPPELRGELARIGAELVAAHGEGA